MRRSGDSSRDKKLRKHDAIIFLFRSSRESDISRTRHFHCARNKIKRDGLYSLSGNQLSEYKLVALLFSTSYTTHVMSHVLSLMYVMDLKKLDIYFSGT